MLRLFRFTFISIIAFALILLIVRWIGNTQPLPAADLWNAIFTNPDGSPCQRPCMFGVQPGITKYQDGIALLKSHPFVKSKLAEQLQVSENDYLPVMS